ncbi:MAG: lasso peptide biosynthesis B2 protein [Deltaproteobacteria bacterium]|nr:lasso peptide biosynthesis B2 protein [Deltaproteobacteria bacterium]
MDINRIAKLLERARELTLDDWQFVGESVFELLRVDLKLSLLPYSRWRDELLEAAQAEGEATPEELGQGLLLVDRFIWAQRLYPRRVNCLRRALTLYRLFRRRQLPATLKIGVTQGPGPFGAHAWLEQDGEPIYEADARAAEQHLTFYFDEPVSA